MIRFDNVSFHYGGEHGTGEGVDNINLEIGTGETVVFCGESGCGKTTLTRLINGLAPHFYEGVMEGAVLADDFNITEAELHETASYVGSVFQNPKSQFFNVDTTGELAFGCENLGMPQEEIRAKVEKTRNDMKLDALMNRNIFELSGGEKQQIACGSVYTSDPKIYVLDEPSSNLDKKAIKRLHDILTEIKRAGRTIVISEHRLYYLTDIADRFIYMEDGRITEILTNDDMKALSDDELRKRGLRCTDINKIDKAESNRDFDGVLAGSALEGIDISCNRGRTQILDIDRLSFPKNSIVAVIGDNGCGKSTLAETLSGVIPGSGSISFNGRYLNDKERAHKSYMVMQDVNRQLFSDSVMEEVLLNAEMPREEAYEVLKELGLDEQSERHPASLSGGQKQRVAIASAVCAGKEVIFYDEPTSGLDLRGMERFGELLRRMRERVSLSVIITHDPELIMQCCTHILHVENGRILSFYPLNEEGVQRVRYYFLSENDESTSKPREKLSSIGKILQYTGDRKKYTYLAVALMLIGAAASVIPFIAVYGIIDKVISGETVTPVSAAGTIGIVFICELIYAVFYTFGLKYSHIAAYATLENIRKSLQEKMEKQALGDVKEMGTGAIKKLFTDDVESIEILLAHIIPEGIANVAVPAALLIVMFGIDWQLALLTIFMILFGIAASKQMFSVGMDKMGSYFAASKRLNNTIIEYVNGMEVVRVFNRQGETGEKYSRAVSEYRDFALKWYEVCWPWMSMYGSIFASITLYSLPLGAILILTGHLALSKYILILCMSFGMGPLLLHVIGFMGAFPQVSYKIQALEKAMDRRPLKTGTEEFSGRNYDIELKDVRFGYKGDEVIKGMSFIAKEGEMTALVGASGSGKSTIARLIVHYYDAESGQITIGGQSINKISLEALSEKISYVSQELFLYNKTIMENIRIGRPDATDDEVIEAARKANCDEFIQALSEGYNTPAGSAGSKLSGGQRQRIAFARAILKDAPIVILDEATAFIDPENESKMNEAIREIIDGKTVVVIAHKLKQTAGADKIIVLDSGRIIAEGRHEELLSGCPEYRNLWETSESASGWLLRNEVTA